MRFPRPIEGLALLAALACGTREGSGPPVERPTPGVDSAMAPIAHDTSMTSDSAMARDTSAKPPPPQTGTDTTSVPALGGPGAEVARLPEFPWPPARPTTRYVLPFRLLPIGPTTTLGEIYDRLVAALDRGEIVERSVYGRGENGFALVARLETIDDEGKAKPGQLRWQATPPRPEHFSLSGYLNRLLRAEPGRYRVIAFVVTGDPVVAGRNAPTSGEMSDMVAGGAGMLPERYRAMQVAEAHCEALIYEFFRRSEGSQAKLVTQSSISPAKHLAGAGLWSPRELTP